jgi:hypothetical protein
VPGGIGIPTGIFRDPGPEIPVFWVSRDNPDAGIIPVKNPVIPIPARGSIPNPGPDPDRFSAVFRDFIYSFFTPNPGPRSKFSMFYYFLSI